jgi:hypothetical protein
MKNNIEFGEIYGETYIPVDWDDFENIHYKENWLDKLFPKSIAHYRSSYALLHPWIIAEYWIEEIKYAWQRVFRGWDDRVVWSIDWYLANTIPKWLQMLKEKKHGVPGMMFEKTDYIGEDYEIPEEIFNKRNEEYNAILDEIIEGFVAYQNMSDIYDREKLDPLQQKFDKGMKLFVKWFNTFWD